MALGTEVHLASASLLGGSRAWASTGSEFGGDAVCTAASLWGGKLVGVLKQSSVELAKPNSENPLCKVDFVMLLPLQEPSDLTK